MSDKLIRYEALAALVAALNSQIALAGQASTSANSSATAANNATAASTAQTATTFQRTTETIAARDSANYYAGTANTATNSANAAAASANSAGGSATTQAAYAKTQGDYAKTQGDYAKSAATSVGDMSRGVYDTNYDGIVDNAAQLGGVVPAGYVRSSGGSQDRVMATNQGAVTPGSLSTAQGFGRFRVGYVSESSGPYCDVIDLSTGLSSGYGGINALYFRKDYSRITHKFGSWGAGSWATARDLAYLDEVALASEAITRSGNVAMTGTLQLSVNGFAFPNNVYGGGGDFARVYLTATSGENQELRIEVGNDGPLDRISLRSFAADGSVSPDGVLVGPWRIWNEGNFDPATKAPITAPIFNGNVTTNTGSFFVTAGYMGTGTNSLTLATNAGKDIALSPNTGRVAVAGYLDVTGNVLVGGSVRTGTITSAAPVQFLDLAASAQGIYAGKLQVGPNYGSLLDPGANGVSVTGDLLVGGHTRVNTLPVFEGTSARTNSGTPQIDTLSGGVPLQSDTGFRIGLNGVIAYNNSNTPAVTVSRVASTVSRSGWQLKVHYDPALGGTSPGLGGFYQPVSARVGASYLHRVRASFPAGMTINAASNSIGAGGSIKWITPQVGTGKFEDYACLILIGTGSVANFGYMYLTGTSGAFDWFVEDSCVYDLSVNGLSELLSGGATFAGPITANGGITTATLTATGQINLPGAGPSNLLTTGTGDGATFATHNVRMRLWWGLGISDNNDAVNGVYDARQGRWTVATGYSIGQNTSMTVGVSNTLRITTPGGYLDIGAQNASGMHYYTDRGNNYFNKPIVTALGGLTATANADFGGASAYYGPTSATINGQAVVVTNDTRLKDWGLYSTTGQDFKARGGRVIVAGDSGNGGPGRLYLNYAGDFTSGVQLMGASGLTVDGALGVGGAATFNSPVTMASGKDFVLQASGASNYDPGDVIYLSGAGVEMARVYANQNQLKLRVNGDDTTGLLITNTSSTVYKPMVSNLDVGAFDTNMFGRSHFQAQSSNAGTPPSYGFLKPGVFGLALYMTDTGNLRTRGSDNADYLVFTGREVDATQVTGVRSTNINGQDANSDRAGGLYHGNNNANAPLANTYHYFWQNTHDDYSFGAQLAQHYFSENFSIRRKDNGVWQPWRQVFHTGNFDPATKLDKTGGTITGALTVTGVVSAQDFLKTSTRASKQAIQSYAGDALNELSQLEIVTFEYIANPGTQHVGIIADDVDNELIAPDHAAFSTTNTVALLVRAVQQLSAEVAQLRQIVDGR